ncbi:MAG TPA: hypothetical protein VGN12_10390 [Pirellulales bacterium]|jgi:hypothetical protein
MGTLSTMTAPLVPLAIAGRVLLGSPLTLRDYGEIEQAMLADRAADRERSDIQAADEAEKTITPLALAEWMCGPGLGYVLWAVIRKQHEAMTLDECRALVEADGSVVRVAQELDRASGLPRGNGYRQALRRPTTAMSLAA